MRKAKKTLDITQQKTLNTMIAFLFIIAVISMVVSANVINAEMCAAEKALIEAQNRPTDKKEFNGSEVPDEYKTEEIDAGRVNKGELILVNNETSYKLDGENLVNLHEHYNNMYDVSDMEVKVSADIVDSMNRMLMAFYDENGGESDILVASGYRSKETQQALYEDQDKDSSGGDDQEWVAKPGHSEHQTGLAFDLSIMRDGLTIDYDGSGRYSFINENCQRYGFVVRYPQDKTEKTGIGYEPWHFRYVGKAHAWNMTNLNLCLEEYTVLLQKRTIRDPLFFTDGDNKNYMAYYVACTGLVTDVKVPLHYTYSISGDNQNGFFVTVEL